MKYLAYVRVEFLRAFQYRANLWARVLAPFVLALIQLSVWTAVYRGRSNVAGLTPETALSYVAMARVVSGLLGEPARLTTRRRVWSGDIAHDLVKPVDLHLQLMFQHFGTALASLVFSGLPLVLVFRFLGIVRAPEPKVMIAFIVSVLMGYVTVFSTAFAASIIAFRTRSPVGIGHVYTLVELLSGCYFPLDFLPPWLGKVALVLPFREIHYVPLSIWSGIAGPAQVAGALVRQLGWTAAMVVICRAFWWRALRSLTIQGG